MPLELLPQHRWREGLVLVASAHETSLPIQTVIAALGPDGALTAAAVLRRQRLPESGLQVVLSLGGAWLERDEPELAQRLNSEAVSIGARSIISENWIRRESEEASRFTRLGMHPDGKLTHFLAPVAEYAALLGGLEDRLRALNTVPNNVRLTSIDQVPLGAILQMQMDFIGGNTGVMTERLRSRGPNPFHPPLSVVAVLDGQPLGFVLTYLAERNVAVVEARVIAPAYRRRWVNVVVMAEAARRALKFGIEHVRFAARDTNEDTRRLARKVRGAQTLDRYFKMVKRSAGA